MSVALSDQEMEGIRQRTSDELLAIWQANDRSQWSGSQINAISYVLFERGIVAPLQDGHVSTASSLEGVHGWLLFFCVILVIISPLANFLEAAKYKNLPWGAWILALALEGFSIYAGVELWRVAPGAVKKAKAFLWTYLAFTVTGGVAFLSLSDEATAKDLADTLRSVVFFCFWYLYLIRSKRVKNTYCR